MPTVRKTIAQAQPLSPDQHARLATIKDSEIDFSDAPEITAAAIRKGAVKIIGRGGARPGAGRKPSGRHPVSLRLKLSTITLLRRQAKKAGQSLSEYAEAKLLAK